MLFPLRKAVVKLISPSEKELLEVHCLAACQIGWDFNDMSNSSSPTLCLLFIMDVQLVEP